MEPLKYENGKPLKYEMGLATRKRHGDMARAWAVASRREWVGLRLSEYSLSLLCLASHFPFFFFFFSFCFLRFLLSPFGFVLLRVRAEFFFSFKIYMGHRHLGWLDDGLHDFWEEGSS